MTNGNDQTGNYEMYLPAVLAADLAQSRGNGRRYVSGALEVLAGEHGLNLDERSMGFVLGATASEEGIKKAIEVYASKFEEERGKVPVEKLVPQYEDVLGPLPKDYQEKIRSQFTRHSGKTLNDVKKEVGKSNWILQDPDGNTFSEEEKSKARETLEMYSKFVKTISELDGYELEKLRPLAVEATRQKGLGKLAEEL